MRGFAGIDLAWYLAKRIISILVVVLLVASAIFAVFFLQGDPIDKLVPKTSNIELRQEIISDLKLDSSVAHQYLNFMERTFGGRFFESTGVWKGGSTGEAIYTPLGNTLALFSSVLVVGLLLGLLVGHFTSGNRESKLPSRFARLVSLGFVAVPITSASLVLLYYVANYQSNVPIVNNSVLALEASLPIAVGSYILLMKGKERYFGAGSAAVTKPIPATPMTKLYVAWVMVVILLADMIFDTRGLGQITWDALIRRDGPVLIACIFLVAVTVAMTNFVLDIASPFVKSFLSQRKRAAEPIPFLKASEPVAQRVGNENVGGDRCWVEWRRTTFEDLWVSWHWQ